MRDGSNAPIELLQGNGDRANGQRGEAQRERERSDSGRERQLDRKFGLALGRIPPRQGLLLNSLHDPVEVVINNHDPTFGLRHEGVAGCAVVARVGDARLPREIGQDVNFAFNRLNDRGIDFGNRLQIGIEPRLGAVPPLAEKPRAA